MQFTPQKGILVDKPLTVWFFFERDCPICAFVKRYVLRPMSFQGMIKLEPYDKRPFKLFYLCLISAKIDVF